MTSAERQRVEGFGQLADGLRDADDVVPVGPVPQRAPVGHGPRGLQRRRRRMGLVPPRPRPLARLPLGRGRDGRLLRHRATAVPRAGAVERPRPDPQGADVRPHRRPGQPRRGRQGVLVVPRRRPQPRLEPLALPLPAGGVPVRRPHRRERSSRQVRPRVRAARHRRLRRRPLLDRRGRLRQGRPDRRDHGRSGPPTPGPTPTRCTCCRRSGSATRGRGTPTHAEARAAAPAADGAVVDRPPVPRRARAARRRRPRRRRPDAAVLRERDERRAPLRVDRARRRTRRTASTTTWSTAPPPSTPTRRGTKAAFWYQLRGRRRRDGRVAAPPAPDGLQAGRRRRARRGLRPRRRPAPPRGRRVLRRADARRHRVADEAMVMRQAFAGMLWSKQLYAYDVERWLDGDPTQPPPPASRRTGRNARWSNFDAFDIMSMPDKWEYPWFAAWDMAFHCVALAHVDPAFAKYQLLLLCREWFQHPNGALPAYEWDFGDVNPPVQAWAALEVFAIDGARDLDFLSRVFDKLLVNFTWWVNLAGRRRQQPVRGRVPRARQHRAARPLAPAGRRHAGAVRRHRMDGVLRARRWPASRRSSTAPASARPATWCSSSSSTSPRSAGRCSTSGVWDDADGLYYDQLVTPDGDRRAGQGAVDGRHHPALRRGGHRRGAARPRPRRWASGFARLRRRPRRRSRRSSTKAWSAASRATAACCSASSASTRSCAGPRQAVRRGRVPLAVRSAGRVRVPPRAPLRARRRGPPRHHRLRAGRVDDVDVRRQLQLAGPDLVPAQLPADQRPRSLRPLLRRRPPLEYPTGSGHDARASTDIAADLRARLVALFVRGDDGRRPCFGGVERLQRDPAWKDNLVFNEYFHGDDGAGLGASHQTGWTGVVADLIRGRPGDGVYAVGDLFRIVHPTRS